MTGSQQALYYYMANQETINKGHFGEYVAIYNNKIEGYYKDYWSGFRAMAQKKYPLNSFGVQHCLPDNQSAADVGGLMVETGGTFWQRSH